MKVRPEASSINLMTPVKRDMRSVFAGKYAAECNGLIWGNGC